MFSADVDTARGAGRWLIFLFHSLLPSNANWYAGIDVTSVTGSISHAESLGYVWIDTVVDAGAYWRGQKTLTAVTPATSGDTTTWSWTLPPHFPTGKYLRVSVDGGTLSHNGAPLTWNEHG